MPGREQRHERLDAVGQHHRHRVAGTDTETGQDRGQPVDDVRELLVGQSVVGVDEAGGPRVPLPADRREQDGMNKIALDHGAW